jgi:hypothetical protein
MNKVLLIVGLVAITVPRLFAAQMNVVLLADFSRVDLPIGISGPCLGQHCLVNAALFVSDHGPHKIMLGRFGTSLPCPIDAYYLPPDFIDRYEASSLKPVLLQPIWVPCPGNAKCIPPGTFDRNPTVPPLTIGEQCDPAARCLPLDFPRTSTLNAASPQHIPSNMLSRGLLSSLCSGSCRVKRQ